VFLRGRKALESCTRLDGVIETGVLLHQAGVLRQTLFNYVSLFHSLTMLFPSKLRLNASPFHFRPLLSSLLNLYVSPLLYTNQTNWV
jgi:hypothetical protein